MAGIRNLEVAGTTDIDTIIFNGEEINKVVYGATTVWEKVTADMGTLHYMKDGVLTTYQLTSANELQAFNRSSNKTSPIVLASLTVDPDDVIGYDIGADVTTLPQFFMSYLKNYNWPITLDRVIGIKGGDQFALYWFSHLDSFNSSVTITENFRINANEPISDLEGLCTYNPSFNQPMALPSTLTTTGGLLRGCTSFNQPIVYPESVTSIGGFRDCPNMLGPITISNTNYTSISAEFCLMEKSAVPDAATSPAFLTGVTIDGAGASHLRDSIFNYNGYYRSPETVYRNIIGVSRWLPAPPGT